MCGTTSVAQERAVPTRVKLRDEEGRQREGLHRGMGQPYEQAWDDAELKAILTLAKGDGIVALRLWFLIVQAQFIKAHITHGTQLIPGQVQKLRELPVRQVYLHQGGLYRIEADGRITERLL